MFRLNVDEARQVVKQVGSGQHWKFDHPVSPNQANTAISYLNSLGFQVRRVSDNSPIKLVAPAEASLDEVPEDVVEEEEARLLRTGDILEFSFKGDALDLTADYLKLWVFSLLTLGLYSFWGRTQLRRYVWGNLICGGEPFRYQGTPRELATTGIKLLVFFLVSFLFLVWLHKVDPLLSPYIEKLFILVCLLGWIYLIWNSAQYRFSKTEWQDIRFALKGSFRSWLGFHLKGWMFLVLTLGLYGPVYLSQARKYRLEQTTFGGQAFRYSGTWRDLAQPYFIGWGVTAITAGWGAPVWLWSWFEIKKSLWEHSHFDKGTIEFNANWKSFGQLQLGNILILIFSLGLGYPVIKKRNLEYTASHLALVGIPRWQQRIKELKQEGEKKKQQAFKNFKIH